ncbi:hypothetical protein [Lysinibacillus sp. SGAir0095]|uniref:hypothetical protein n=1 Tax=Lysinibacillus sp. SGAir0095 TaxID=2070463 RepID=UPI0010CD441F|nr:hypothetical protein [Lysinibacillus sp. SGAir0095]QCR33141.1 hypothetical protein C1N55_13545 [Lysinibacillus sp. SGAir0095]
MNLTEFFFPELIKALLVVSPLIILGVIVGLAFNFARDLLEAFLSSSVGKVFIAVAILVFAIKVW